MVLGVWPKASNHHGANEGAGLQKRISFSAIHIPRSENQIKKLILRCNILILSKMILFWQNFSQQQ